MAFFCLLPYYGLKDCSICWSGATDPLGLLCLVPGPGILERGTARHDGADGRVVGWMGGMGTGKWGKTGSLGKRNIVSLFWGGWSNMIPVD